MGVYLRILIPSRLGLFMSFSISAGVRMGLGIGGCE